MPTPAPVPAPPPVALITGGSAGLGRALLGALAARRWTVVTDGRDPAALAAVADLPGVRALPGDLADAGHRDRLAAAATEAGRLDLLVHNASTLGPLPRRRLRDLDPRDLDGVWAVNAAAPHALTRLLVDLLRASDGVLLSLSSDVVTDHHAGWGGYAATKAALDHLTLTWGIEESVAAYAVDPGDMRTRMHQDAFPGEDVTDRPDPATVVPVLLALLEQRPPSGRYRADDLAAPAGAGATR
ncbi:SDR family NAD(P)-dependent oxidoreductase [Lapillicoccus sp.]|uniref:SDR family NAD(P)-dependent oxidoreductase n=1 Tax=Lapillicoccus sp. TaxID=1909287 RepID=UPI0039836E6D